ncbi:MAG: Trp biosynthesis-associated membrane protein [Actinomycetota bacterium]|nr:Trp biosynthesis-associated membrane protein [Actinomycetota bacterium]
MGLLALGAALLLLAGWVAPRPAGTAALALVAGAGAAAALAARGWARRVVGVLVAATGGSAVVLGVTTGSWPAAAGGLAVLAGGGWVAWRGPRWSRLPARYDREPAVSDAPHALWDALDRGEDPTD